MKATLRLPAVLAVVVLTAAGVAAGLASCDSGKPEPDASPSCDLYCFPTGSGSGSANCPFPTCADTAGNCPADCEPVG